MKRIPLETISTGGGCTCFFATLPNGWHLVITDANDPSIPDAKTEKVDVCIYRDEAWMDQVVRETHTLRSRIAKANPQYMKDVVCGAIAWQVAEKHCELHEEDPYAGKHLGPQKFLLVTAEGDVDEDEGMTKKEIFEMLAKELDQLTIDIPRSSVEALLVAINNHAHSFAVSAQELMLKKKRTKGEERDLKVWSAHAVALQAVKIDIKRKVGIK